MGKTKQRLLAIGDRVFRCRRRKKKDFTAYLNLLPVSVLERIFTFACVDGGFTGASLSRVSKSIRHLSSATRFHSVALCSGTAAQVGAFHALFAMHRRLAIQRKPTLAHLYISSSFSKCLSGSPGTLQREEEEFRRRVFSLMRLVAPELETLCVVKCADTPHALDFIRPLSPSPNDITLTFPNLRELMLVGSGIMYRDVPPSDDLTAEHAPEAFFPRLTRLQFVATVMELANWPVLAPNLTHMRITDHDRYGARQVIRSTLMDATRRVLKSESPLELPRAYAPETVYMLLDGSAGRVLRCYEPRVVEAESDWEEVMKREWLERIGGGLGCWAVVQRRASVDVKDR